MGKRIILTLRNANNEAKCVSCQGNHTSNDKGMSKMERRVEIQRIKPERGISYTEAKRQIYIFNSVRTTYAQATIATKPTVKTVTVETQAEMTWPDGIKQFKKCAVEKQTTKVNNLVHQVRQVHLKMTILN